MNLLPVLLLSLALPALSAGGNWSRPGDGPGFPQITWKPEELFKSAFTFPVYQSWGNNYVSLHNGYLLLVHARDGKPGGGGLAFWNMANPRQPALLNYDTSATQEFMEQHGYGFSSFGGRDYACFTSVQGIFFWDLTDVAKGGPKKVGEIALDGITGEGYKHSTFSVFWQAPYAYVAATSHGMFVVDARDIAKPRLVKQLTPAQMGAENGGFIFAVGNQLVILTVLTGNSRAAFLDISDPGNPQLMSSAPLAKATYAGIFNGNRIYTTNDDMRLKAYDAANPYQVKPAWITEPLSSGENPGEYVSLQDGHVLFCNDDRFFKIDTLTRKAVGDGELARVGTEEPGARSHPQEGHPTALGNYMIIADDHGWGSGVVPHAQAPDTRGPDVTMVNPAPGAVRQAPTSRVGLTWSDNITLRSVNAQTFIVREAASKAVVAGRYSGQQLITNFFPDQPLKLDTEYEVVVPKGGITDYAGNATAREFISRFRTRAKAEVVYGMIPRDSMTAAASSVEGAQAAALVLDGDARTAWHSSKDRTAAPLPEDITLTFKAPQVIRKLVYTPSLADASGRAFSYRILASADGVNFTELTAGKWANDDSVKTVGLPEIPAKAVRLVIEDGNGGFASAAEIQIQRVVDGSAATGLGPRRKVSSKARMGTIREGRDLRGRLLDRRPGKLRK